ncbi:MAG: hypothetical protein K2H01_05315 [Ruminococcus sp.]|nr:hypothetical protein [Ruminococcus sp.]
MDENSNIMSYSPIQAEKMLKGGIGVDGRTMGYGMLFLHELYHSDVGGNLKDDRRDFHTGRVVDKMNVIRKELNQLGYNFGERLSYPAIPVGNSNIIPFDKGSKIVLQRNRGIFYKGNKYIKF